MDLRAVAGDLLSEGPQAEERTRVRQSRAEFDRDQRVVLLAAEAEQLPALAGADARRVRLLGQGGAVHHAHEKAQGGGGGAGEPFRVGRAGAEREARADLVAVAAGTGV